MASPTPPLSPPKILPPHYFILCLLLSIGTAWIDHPALLPDPWPFVGLLPIAAGCWLAAMGSRLFARKGTGIVPFSESTALVTEGVFAYSRNPMYSGMVLALAGTALLVNDWLAWLPIIPFVAIIRYYFIANEERHMENAFGGEYLEYKARVRRWL